MRHGERKLFYTDWLSDHPSFLTLAYSVWLLSATGIVMGLLFFVSRLWKPFPLPFAWILDWGPMKKIIDAALLYRRHAKIILYSIALSTLSVFVSILLYQFLGDALGINLTLTHYLFLVPIVMIVSAIPLLPGGIGLGQVAFFTLFQWMGSLEPDKGGALCSVFQVYVLLFNCLGAIFYFKYKHEGQIAPRKQEFKEEVPQRHAGALLQRPV